MPELDSFDYYRRREHQERACAVQTTDPAAAAIHGVMADRYVELMRETKQLEAVFARGPGQW